MEGILKPLSVEATTTFLPFPTLPYELRRKIWEYSISNNRIIEVIYQRRHFRWRATRTSHVYVPLFLTSHESAAVAKSVLVRCFGTWFNLDSDTLWMNSLKSADFADRFFQFGRHLYKACVGGDPEDYEDEQKRFRVLFRLKRLCITWDLWAEANVGVGNDARAEDRWAEFACLEGLEGLVLVMVQWDRDENGMLTPDERQLTDADLQEVSGARNLRLVREGSDMVERSLKCMDGRVQFDFKMIKRGDDGEGGVRAELTLTDQRILKVREDLIAGETQREEREATQSTV